eukprot:TRINITY_DN105162_c0_g1_i1.p1 TRINITY_DN105162_c0_g1~~TRINITY_DN105162_c0_g1_i1.p1  ORF type:complete len:826 (-),score=188.76 TRINITY_DN105162_c0_g1_i1:219-2696(-)
MEYSVGAMEEDDITEEPGNDREQKTAKCGGAQDEQTARMIDDDFTSQSQPHESDSQFAGVLPPHLSEIPETATNDPDLGAPTAESGVPVTGTVSSADSIESSRDRRPTAEVDVTSTDAVSSSSVDNNTDGRTTAEPDIPVVGAVSSSCLETSRDESATADNDIPETGAIVETDVATEGVSSDCLEKGRTCAANIGAAEDYGMAAESCDGPKPRSAEDVAAARVEQKPHIDDKGAAVQAHDTAAQPRDTATQPRDMASLPAGMLPAGVVRIPGAYPAADRHETDTPKVKADVPAAGAGGDCDSTAEGKCDDGSKATQVETDQADQATADMVRELSAFMQKRRDRASDAVMQEVLDKLPAALHADDVESALRSSMRTLLHESSQLGDQIGKLEKSASQVLKRMSDPEASKQVPGQKQLKEAVEKELAKWKDGNLSKKVLKAFESKYFEQSFLESLQDGAGGSSEAASPLLESLRPTRQQLVEALRMDYAEWCGGVATQHISNALQAGEFVLAKHTMEGALKEVAAQYDKATDKLLSQIRGQSKAAQMASTFRKGVADAVCREVKHFEVELRKKSTSTPSVASPGSVSASGLRESFASRLRVATAPLQRDLNLAARDIALAGASLENCRMVLARSGNEPRCSTSDASLERNAVLAAAASGKLRDALERAMAWDAQNNVCTDSACKASLVEDVLLHLQDVSQAEEEDTLPEDLLSRPDVATELKDTQLRLTLTCALLELAVRHGASLVQLERNLDWAVGLMHAVECNDSELSSGLEKMQPRIAYALDQIQRGKAPASLEEAGPAERRRVASTARLAMKSLAVLTRMIAR